MTAAASLFHHIEELINRIGLDHYFKHHRYPKLVMRIGRTYWSQMVYEMSVEATKSCDIYAPAWMRNVTVVIWNDLPGVLITIDK